MKNFLSTIILWLICHVAFAQAKDIHSTATYHKANNALKSKAEYYYDPWSEQEIFHGRYTEWDSKGTLIYEAQYVDGKLMGQVVSYHPNGIIAKIENWFNGKREGKSQVFYANGQLKQSCVYVNDMLEGEIQLYTRKGKRKDSSTNKAGRKENV